MSFASSPDRARDGIFYPRLDLEAFKATLGRDVNGIKLTFRLLFVLTEKKLEMVGI